MPTYPYPYGYPGRGDLSIDSNPQGAFVYIDGYALTDESGNAMVTPVKVVGVLEGIHEIQISLEGYHSKKIFLDIVPNKVNSIFVTLESIYE